VRALSLHDALPIYALVARARLDVPWRAVDVRLAVGVELRVILHDRAERGHRRRPQVKLGARYLAAETGDIPAPEGNAGNTRIQPRQDRVPERIPCRAFVARPMRRCALRPGETGAAEGERVAVTMLIDEPVVGFGIV